MRITIEEKDSRKKNQKDVYRILATCNVYMAKIVNKFVN